MSSGVWEIEVDKGNWTVKCDGYEDGTVSVSSVKVYDIVMSIAISTTLNDNSWEIISMISQQGKATQYWSVGDRKTIIMNGTINTVTLTNYEIQVFIIGMNHNSALEGENLIHFKIGKKNIIGIDTQRAFYDQYYENESYSLRKQFCMHLDTSTGKGYNARGWKGAVQMRAILTAMQNALPSELQNVLKTCSKYTDNVANGSEAPENVTPTSDTLSLCSSVEIFNEVGHSNPAEANYQQQYDYYKAGNNKRYYGYSQNKNMDIWMRSPYAKTTTMYCLQYETTTSPYTVISDAIDGNRSRGVSPIFFV